MADYIQLTPEEVQKALPGGGSASPQGIQLSPEEVQSIISQPVQNVNPSGAQAPVITDQPSANVGMPSPRPSLQNQLGLGGVYRSSTGAIPMNPPGMDLYNPEVSRMAGLRSQAEQMYDKQNGPPGLPLPPTVQPIQDVFKGAQLSPAESHTLGIGPVATALQRIPGAFGETMTTPGNAALGAGMALVPEASLLSSVLKALFTGQMLSQGTAQAAQGAGKVAGGDVSGLTDMGVGGLAGVLGGKIGQDVLETPAVKAGRMLKEGVKEGYPSAVSPDSIARLQSAGNVQPYDFAAKQNIPGHEVLEFHQPTLQAGDPYPLKRIIVQPDVPVETPKIVPAKGNAVGVEKEPILTNPLYGSKFDRLNNDYQPSAEANPVKTGGVIVPGAEAQYQAYKKEYEARLNGPAPETPEDMQRFTYLRDKLNELGPQGLAEKKAQAEPSGVSKTLEAAAGSQRQGRPFNLSPEEAQQWFEQYKKRKSNRVEFPKDTEFDADTEAAWDISMKNGFQGVPRGNNQFAFLGLSKDKARTEGINVEDWYNNRKNDIQQKYREAGYDSSYLGDSNFQSGDSHGDPVFKIWKNGTPEPTTNYKFIMSPDGEKHIAVSDDINKLAVNVQGLHVDPKGQWDIAKERGWIAAEVKDGKIVSTEGEPNQVQREALSVFGSKISDIPREILSKLTPRELHSMTPDEVRALLQQHDIENRQADKMALEDKVSKMGDKTFGDALRNRKQQLKEALANDPENQQLREHYVQISKVLEGHENLQSQRKGTPEGEPENQIPKFGSYKTQPIERPGTGMHTATSGSGLSEEYGSVDRYIQHLNRRLRGDTKSGMETDPAIRQKLQEELDRYNQKDVHDRLASVLRRNEPYDYQHPADRKEMPESELSQPDKGPQYVSKGKPYGDIPKYGDVDIPMGGKLEEGGQNNTGFRNFLKAEIERAKSAGNSVEVKRLTKELANLQKSEQQTRDAIDIRNQRKESASGEDFGESDFSRSRKDFEDIHKDPEVQKFNQEMFRRLGESMPEVAKALGVKGGESHLNALETFKSLANSQDVPSVVREFSKLFADKFSKPLEGGKVYPDMFSNSSGYYEADFHRAAFDPTMRPEDIYDAVLHEGLHVASEYTVNRPVTSAQRFARMKLETVREALKASFPDYVKKVFNEDFIPAVAARRKGENISLAKVLQDKGVAPDYWRDKLYAASNVDELVSMTPQMLQDLNTIPYKDGYLSDAWHDGMRQLLGVKKGSVADHVMDAVMHASADQDTWLANYSRVRNVNELRQMAPSSSQITWLSQNYLTGIRKPRGFGEAKDQYLRYLAGHSAPFHMGADEALGNKLVRMAVSNVASGPMAESLATSVLGPKFADRSYRTLIGAMIKERDIQANVPGGRHVWAQADSPIKSLADYQAKLSDPDVQKAFQWHDNLVAAQNKVFGGNGLSTFHDAGAKNTYNLDYNHIAGRMISEPYGNFTRKQYVESLVKAGLGEVGAKGTVPPKGFLPVQIGAQKVYIRPDLQGELEQAVRPEGHIQRAVINHMVNAVNTVQLAGITDVVYHTANMFSAIAGSQGGGSVLKDLARKIPGVRGLDTAARIAINVKRVMVNSPEIQEQLAQLSQIGAGRSEGVHMSIADRIQKKIVGFSNGELIKTIDKAGRLALDNMHKDLVSRGWLKDDEQTRREFVNKMGQYNSRLMSRFDQYLRDRGVSPFIVAGKNFNRLAVQRLMLSQGVKAANPEAMAKMKIVDGLGAIATLLAIPIAANYMITGKPLGRSGVPVGTIDTGKDDKDGKPVFVDINQHNLYRRGMRVAGLQALERDSRQERSFKDKRNDMIKESIMALTHPYAGPLVNAGKIMVTGSDWRGDQKSFDPEDVGANVLAALKNMNPAEATLFKNKDENISPTVGSGLKEVAKGIAGPLSGVKSGRYPSLVEQIRERTGDPLGVKGTAEKLDLNQLGDMEDEIKSQRKPLQNPLLADQMAIRATKEEKARTRELQASLTPEAQQFLKRNQLEISGTKDEISTDVGQKTTLLPKQKDTFHQLLSKHYSEGIAELIADERAGDWKDLTQDEKKQELSQVLSDARADAKDELDEVVQNQHKH